MWGKPTRGSKILKVLREEAEWPVIRLYHIRSMHVKQTKANEYHTLIKGPTLHNINTLYILQDTGISALNVRDHYQYEMRNHFA